MPDFTELPSGTLETNDLIAVQQLAGGAGSTHKASISDLLEMQETRLKYRRWLLETAPPVGDRKVYLYRNFATSGARADEYDLCVPFQEGRFAVYGFRGVGGSNGFSGATSVANFGRIREGIAGINVHQSSATKTGTWTGASESRCYGGSYTRSNTAGDTIEFTVTGHTIVLRAPLLTNGGFGLVSIDGDDTAATSLPEVTNTEVTAGWFSAGDLGKRYIEFYAASNVYDEHIVLAEGLDDSSHTVVVTVKGTKRTASTDFRCAISAVSGASVGNLPTDTDASVLYLRDIHNWQAAYSALTTVVNYTPSGQSAEWLGENHGNETQVSAGWYDADGAAITLLSGEVTSSSEIYLDRVTQLTHSATGATVHATKRTRYTARADHAMQLVATYSYTWHTNGTATAFYGGMMNISYRDYDADPTTYTTVFETARLGEATTLTLSGLSDDTFNGQVMTDFFAAFSSAHDTVAVCYIPHVDLTLGNWADASPDYAFLDKRADGTFKQYFTRVSQNDSITITPGTRHEGAVGWRVFRLINADTLLV